MHPNELAFFITSLGILIISSIFALISSMKDGKPTCEKYILNSYLYLTVSISLLICLILLFNLMFPNYVFKMFKGVSMLLMLISHLLLAFLFIYLINTISPLNVYTKRLVWILFITNFAFLLLPLIQIYFMFNQHGMLLSTLLLVIGIVALITLITYFNPDLIIKNSSGWLPYIIAALLILILSQFIPLILCNLFINCNIDYLNSFYYYLAIAGVIIFTFIIIYRTKIIVENAAKCKSPEDADYIKESSGMLISMINLFLDILRVREGKRPKSFALRR
jgi:FtsH-binding integral membrane protein